MKIETDRKLTNLYYCREETKEHIESILASDGVHNFTKDIIKKGLEIDSVEAVSDIKIALQALKAVQRDQMF